VRINEELMEIWPNEVCDIVDRLTKMVHFIPTTEKMLAEGLARLFRDNV